MVEGKVEEKIDEKKVEEEEQIEEKKQISIEQIPEKIEELYAQLDAIRNLLSEIATAIRTGAEATKALTESIEYIRKKIDVPFDAHRKQDEVKRVDVPGAGMSESAKEDASDIMSPERINQFQVGVIRKTVSTPRPEVEQRQGGSDEYGEILKAVLSGKVSFGELADVMKKMYKVG